MAASCDSGATEGRRRRRGAGVFRVVLPLVFVLGGAAAVVWGTGFHTVDVLVEEEVTVPAAPALPPAWDAFRPPGDDFPPPPPPEPSQSYMETIVQTHGENEIILEMTRGGVLRLETGEIKRTWGDQPPSVCPT